LTLRSQQLRYCLLLRLQFLLEYGNAPLELLGRWFFSVGTGFIRRRGSRRGARQYGNQRQREPKVFAREASTLPIHRFTPPFSCRNVGG
jgi:hypothetical protein